MARSRYSEIDRERMRKALERSDADNARRLRNERLARLGCIAIVIFIMVTMFYSCTGAG